MEIMIVLTSGMKVKLCAIEPAALVAFVVLQGIVSPCTGAVMVKMTAETAVMNISVHITIRLVLVTSSLVAIVAVSPESLYVMVMMTAEMGLMKRRLTCIVMNAHVILQSLNVLTLQDAS